jgi:hypothetical protein
MSDRFVRDMTDDEVGGLIADREIHSRMFNAVSRALADSQLWVPLSVRKRAAVAVIAELVRDREADRRQELDTAATRPGCHLGAGTDTKGATPGRSGQCGSFYRRAEQSGPSRPA